MKAALRGIGLAVAALFGSGCQSVSEFNPFSDVHSYEVIVIEDFKGPGTAGFEFSERVARSARASGEFSSVMRGQPDGDALVLRGEITRYSRGNPAMRLRYGHNIGNAVFAARAWVEDLRTGEFVARIELRETYRATDHRNRIHQDLDELAERAAQRLVKELLESDGSPPPELD